MNMSPWWKRPTSESASAAAQKQSEEKGKGRRPARPKQNDNDESDSEPRRRRRGRRGGGRGNRSGNRAGASAPPKGGSRRPKQSGGRRKPATRNGQPVILVEVEALHKHLKIEGDGPSDTAKLFAQVGEGVQRRAVACGMRKQKVQRALKELGFEIERVDGGVEDARLRLALDAFELAIEHKGAQIWLLTQVGGIDVLGDRLRHHGAAVSTFSLSDLPVIGDVTAAADDEDGDEDEDDSTDAPLDDEDEDDDDEDSGEDDTEEEDDADEPRGRQRSRRRRRRRRGGRNDDQDDEGVEGIDARSTGPSKRTKSDSDPFDLLRAAVGKLAEGEGEVVWASKVRQRMFELDPVFNELDHGYRDFDALLREAERRGHVSLQKDPRTSTFIVVAWRAA